MKIWFNDSYKSGETAKIFTRIMVTIGDKEGSFGCIYDGIQTRNGSFEDCSEKTIHGVGNKSYDFNEFAKKYGSGISNSTKKAFTTLMVNLSRSFRYHVQQMSVRKMSIPSSVQNSVYSFLSDCRNQFQMVLDGKLKEIAVEDTAVGKETTAEWVSVDELPADTLNVIVNGLFESSSREFTFDGHLYKLERYTDEKGEENVCIKMLAKGKEIPSYASKKEVKEGTKPVKVIKTKKMAFMLNNEGLGNFTKNVLYEIHGNQDKFTCLTDNYGKKHYVKNDRFQILEVAQELAF